MAAVSMATSPIQCNCCCRRKCFGQMQYRRSPRLDGSRYSQQPDGSTCPTYRATKTKRPQGHLARLFGRSRSALPVGQSGRCITGEYSFMVLCVALSGANGNVVKKERLVRGRSRRCYRAASCTVSPVPYCTAVYMPSYAETLGKRCNCGKSSSFGAGQNVAGKMIRHICATLPIAPQHAAVTSRRLSCCVWGTTTMPGIGI
jgi:hypothetical protein